MEKTGEIKPGITPDTEKKLGEKRASHGQKTEALDDDVTRRLADRVAKPNEQKPGS